MAMFGEILQVFAEKTPVAVMVHGLLQRFLNPDKINKWFGAISEVQYTRKILFSSVLEIMLQVVCKIRSNVHAAYLDSDIEASRIALYGKLQNIELKTSRELVRYSVIQAEQIIKEINGCNEPILAGYRTKFLDGNCIEATEHRIKALRETKSGALPGKSLVIFDPELGIAIDVIPCEDGHAQERSLVQPALDTIETNDLMVADRNFCVLNLLLGIDSKCAYFAIRQHKSMPYKSLSDIKFIGYTDTGKVYEEKVSLKMEGKEIEARRVIVKLKKATRDGEWEIAIFSNLPVEDVDAIKIAEIYKLRWGIETAFQKLEKYLNSEINALGYPKAALFGFCTALVAFNIYAVVMAAIRAAHPEINVNNEVSDYYIAEEISTTSGGMSVIVKEESWSVFVNGGIPEVCEILLYLAGNMNLRKFKKNKRGPKKPPMPKDKFKGKPHVSTAKLLADQG
jgi:hypothetical protein